MKKVVGIVGVLVLIVIGFFGYQYWNSTYNGVDAYAVVIEVKKWPRKMKMAHFTRSMGSNTTHMNTN